MIPAKYTDKSQVVDILTASFDDNKSVNYIIPQDKSRKQRIRRLMEYSFDVCYYFGMVYLSNDKKSCALIVQPERKKTTLRSLLWSIKLIMNCTGVGNARKAIARESAIRKLHPDVPMIYLWFIVLEPTEQNKGIGGSLLSNIIERSKSEGRTICLETSTLKNLPWYKQFGFELYIELNFSYQLFFLKMNDSK